MRIDTMDVQDEATIDVSGERIYKHKVGDEKCQEGWCDGGDRWPKRCKCGGLVHADFGDENSDGDYWLYRKCDRCDDAYECA